MLIGKVLGVDWRSRSYPTCRNHLCTAAFVGTFLGRTSDMRIADQGCYLNVQPRVQVKNTLMHPRVYANGSENK